MRRGLLLVRACLRAGTAPRYELIVISDLVVEAVEALLDALELLECDFALFDEDLPALFIRGVALIEELHVLDKRFNGDVRAAHALNKRDARAILVTVVAHAACVAVRAGQQPYTFVISQRIGADVVLLGYFRDAHDGSAFHEREDSKAPCPIIGLEANSKARVDKGKHRFLLVHYYEEPKNDGNLKLALVLECALRRTLALYA